MQLSRDADRVLLIPFAPGIGDAVMMEPLIRAVRKGLPDLRLTVAAREHISSLLLPEGYDFVFPSVFVERTPAPLKPFHRYIPQRIVAWFAEPALVLDLGPFDKVINLFLAWESEIPFDRWWTPQWPLQEGPRHTVDVMADYLEQEIGVDLPHEERVPRVSVFPEAAEWASEYLRSGGVAGEPVIAMVVSAANALKWWAAPKWAEVINHFSSIGWRPILIAPSGNPQAAEIFDMCDVKPLWPDANLREVSALLKQSDAVVGIDTGPLHVAAALGTPWVGLYGPTNPVVIGPYTTTPGATILAPFPKQDTCKNCWLAFKNREDDCATLPSTGCTTLISVEQVVEAVYDVTRSVMIA